MTPEQESLYKQVKQMETLAQSLIFTIPDPDSQAYQALDLPASEKWRMAQLVDSCIWLREKASRAATSVYMQGKE